MKSRHKIFGLTLLAVALGSSAVWATGRHDHDRDHPSRAWDKNPVFKKFHGSQPPAGGETGAPAYDYRNYIEASTVAAKTFATTSYPAFTAVCGDTETRRYTRQSDAAGTRVAEVRERVRGSSMCQREQLHYLGTDTAYLWERLDRFDPNSGGIAFSRVIVNPVAAYTASMSNSWGGGSPVADGNGMTVGQLLDTGSVLGVESVTVPQGTYSDCLKIQHSRMSNMFGQYSAVSWVCPGMGEVKRVEASPNGTNPRMAEWVLTQVEATP
ncbi:hypothetical protein SVA_0846 [Sulfurifustis variabilis]|uniref:Uncharacterized protein n=1 Tax=Sulfurifustis variabilis TaxID=1675686 RepID=A0A1B4V2A0_9GAMM|nr:hypothetical protein [Sulfurifustis variabilis]BAU47425.1 hypothetical protein SVA_0846 [Sulfurifustis variabilis]